MSNFKENDEIETINNLNEDSNIESNFDYEKKPEIETNEEISSISNEKQNFEETNSIDYDYENINSADTNFENINSVIDNFENETIINENLTEDDFNENLTNSTQIDDSQINENEDKTENETEVEHLYYDWVNNKPNQETNTENLRNLYTIPKLSTDEFADTTNYINGETINHTTKKKSKHLTDGNIFTFLIVFAVVFTSMIYIFNYLLTPIKVVGISMQPTLNSTKYNLGNDDEEHCDIVYYTHGKEYSTNDLLIILNNNNKYINDSRVKSVIKRVIAVEHQSIRFYFDRKELFNSGSGAFQQKYYRYYYKFDVYDQNGNILNIDQSYLTEDMYFTDSDLFYYQEFDFPLFYEIFSRVKNENIQEYIYTISENHYFVMGDNRNHSTDSRFFGEVAYEDIAGSVKIIVTYNTNLLQAIWIKIKSYI